MYVTPAILPTFLLLLLMRTPCLDGLGQTFVMRLATTSRSHTTLRTLFEGETCMGHVSQLGSRFGGTDQSRFRHLLTTINTALSSCGSSRNSMLYRPIVHVIISSIILSPLLPFIIAGCFSTPTTVVAVACGKTATTAVPIWQRRQFIPIVPLVSLTWLHRHFSSSSSRKNLPFISVLSATPPRFSSASNCIRLSTTHLRVSTSSSSCASDNITEEQKIDIIMSSEEESKLSASKIDGKAIHLKFVPTSRHGSRP